MMLFQIKDGDEFLYVAADDYPSAIEKWRKSEELDGKSHPDQVILLDNGGNVII